MAPKHLALVINDYEKYAALVELLGFSTVYVFGIATYDHYTWWSLALVWLYILIVAIAAWLKPAEHTAEQARRALWLAPFLSAFVVVLGVIIMSSLPCSLLTDLYVENGPLKYTGGNFLVHYYPLIRMVLFAPIRFKAEKPLVFVLHLILIYTLAFDPNKIYGCAALPRAATTALLAGIPFLLLAAVITC